MRSSLAAVILAVGMMAGASVPVRAASNNTITISNAQPGQTYTLYRLFNATVNDTRAAGSSSSGIAYNYTVTSGKQLSDTYTYTDEKGGSHSVTGTTWFSTDAAGNVTAVADANLTTEDFQQWAQKFGTKIGESQTVDSSKTGSQTLTFNNLSDGYYFITSTMGSLVTVTSVAPNQEVVDKNTNPDVNKTEDVKTSDAGDIVTYTTEVHLTYNCSNVIFHDRLADDLVLQEQAPKSVKLGSSTGADLTATTDYTVDYFNATKSTTAGTTNGDNITISFTSAYLNNVPKAGSTIFITYTAKLSDRAGINMANEAYVSYGSNNTESVHKKVYESTFNFNVKKLDGSVTPNKTLNGAIFALSTKSNLGNLTEDNVSSHSSDLLSFKDGGVYDQTNASTSSKTFTAKNSISFKGLNNDETDTITYYLYEVKAPDGYNKLTGPIAIQIIPTFEADNTASHGTQVTSYEVKYQLPNATTWESSVDDSGNKATSIEVAHNINVLNIQGSVLPSTGGMGTTIFYVIGGILIAGAVVLLISRKRRT